jgi:hypothetical protein
MFQKVSLLLISVGLAIVAVFIQQFFISDNPVKADVQINGNKYTFKLPVFYEGDEECIIVLSIPDKGVKGSVSYKVASSNDKWKTNKLIRMNDNLVSVIPRQKPNIKIEYFITLASYSKTYTMPLGNPIYIRYQKMVPKPIFYPYVLTLFMALILACYTGFLTVYNINPFKKYIQLTFYLLICSIVLGLIVHLISFRHLFLQLSPYNDLTFYKNLIIFLLWFGIYQLNKKKEYRFMTLAVAILTLLLYCTPQHIVFHYLY